MKKNKLYIVGTKTLADMIIDVAHRCGYSIMGFFDDVSKEKTYKNMPIIGPTSTYLSRPSDYTGASFAVAIGENKSRGILSDKIVKAKLSLATIIDPTATIMPTATIGSGSIIFAQSYIGTSVVMTQGNLVFPRVVITHHSQVGAYNFFAPGVTVGGHANIGSYTKLGMNSVIAAHSTIKDDFTCPPLTYVIK